MEKYLFRNGDISHLREFSKYIEAVKSHCPFIALSQKENLLFFSEYRLQGKTIEDLWEEVFYIGLLHTELLRKKRIQQTTKHAFGLLCENIIFHVNSSEIKIDGKELLSWPHWLLKLLYTDVGILFGKFWKGEQDTARDGRAIPIPPENFLSVRTAVKSLDERFFANAPFLTEEFIQSHDDNNQVLTKIPQSHKCESIESLATATFSIDSEEACRKLCNELKLIHLFEQVKLWAESRVNTH